MPKKGVTPAHLKKYQFKPGHGSKAKTGGTHMGKAKRAVGYAKKGASWLKKGGPIANAGTVMGGLLGASPAIQQTFGQGVEAAPINGLYTWTGIDVSNKKFDVMQPIQSWGLTLVGALGGRILGKVVERGLEMVGINPANPLGS